jgi:hypothetical protein
MTGLMYQGAMLADPVKVIPICKNNVKLPSA